MNAYYQRVRILRRGRVLGWIFIIGLFAGDPGGAANLPLFDEQSNFSQLLYWNLAGQATNTSSDKFTGYTALKITTQPGTTNTASQIFSVTVDDGTNYFPWEHFIVQNPTLPGEYRYLMFSWKNTGGPGKMALYLYQDNGQGSNTIQIAGGSWVPGSNRLVLPTPVPKEWETVIVDLYQEFGNACITGIGFYWYQGAANPASSWGLFDNICLGTGISELRSRIPSSTLIADSFSRTGVLNLSVPDTRFKGETWSTVVTGADNWTNNGSAAVISPGSGADNAYLPFCPTNGRVYSLSAQIAVTSGSGSTNWIGLAFMPSAASGNIFTTAAGGILLRGDGVLLASFGGTNTSYTLGTTTAAVQVILDTTSVKWRMDWLVNGVLIRSETFAQNPAITKIGIGNINGTGGTVDNLELTGN